MSKGGGGRGTVPTCLENQTFRAESVESSGKILLKRLGAADKKCAPQNPDGPICLCKYLRASGRFFPFLQPGHCPWTTPKVPRQAPGPRVAGSASSEGRRWLIQPLGFRKNPSPPVERNQVLQPVIPVPNLLQIEKTGKR